MLVFSLSFLLLLITGRAWAAFVSLVLIRLAAQPIVTREEVPAPVVLAPASTLLFLIVRLMDHGALAVVLPIRVMNLEQIPELQQPALAVFSLFLPNPVHAPATPKER